MISFISPPLGLSVCAQGLAHDCFWLARIPWREVSGTRKCLLLTGARSLETVVEKIVGEMAENYSKSKLKRKKSSVEDLQPEVSSRGAVKRSHTTLFSGGCTAEPGRRWVFCSSCLFPSHRCSALTRVYHCFLHTTVPFYNVSDFNKAFTGRENETPNEGTNLHSNLKYFCFLACQLKCTIDRTSLLDLLRTSGMPLENSACSWSNSTHLFRYKAPHLVNLTSSLRCVLVWGRNQKNILYKSRFVELLHAEWKVYIWVF